jgi:hypothetical protein
MIDIWEWLKSQKSETISDIRSFLMSLKHELERTAEGTTLLVKLARRRKLTAVEMTSLKVQLIDLGKGIPLLGLIILPGGSIAVVALVKLANHLGIDLMPSTFKLAKKKKLRCTTD